MERRKSSAANGSDILGIRKGTDDQMELGRFQFPRRDSINPRDHYYNKDGFRRPNENRQRGEENFRNSLIGSPMIQPEDKKENLCLIDPINPIIAYSPIQMSVMNPVILTPAYPPNGMQWIPSVYPAECSRKINECGYPMNDMNNEGIPQNYARSPLLKSSPVICQTSQKLTKPIITIPSQHKNFRLDDNPPPIVNEPQELPEYKSERRIGGLTVAEHQDKVKKYLEKRRRRVWKKKVSYDCRKKVADKRLRIKGRFVTKDQACAILGTTTADLANNELFKTLIMNNDNCSIVTSAKNMKIRNIQTLFNSADKFKNPKNGKETSNKTKEIIDNLQGKNKKDIKVEFLKKDFKERVVEIKIEALSGNNNFEEENDIGLPKIDNPIFQFKRLKPEELNPKHVKHHTEIV